MSNCNCHSDTLRDGASQLGRMLKALDPAYAKVDERSLADLLNFAKGYADLIRFYDIPESRMLEKGKQVSWLEFFRRDMAVIAASIATLDMASIRQSYISSRNSAENFPGGNSFAKIFQPIIDMIGLVDSWYAIAIPENPLYEDLELAIESNLKNQLQKLRAYEKGYGQFDPSNPIKINYSKIKNKEKWGLGDDVDPQSDIFSGPNFEEKILNAILHVDDVYNSFYGFLNALAEKSPGYLQYALKQYPSHQPHMALFIAFLQLFQLAQAQANELTGKMLDFYYRDVLRLSPKPSISDRAYVVFQLAKDIATYDLTKGTTFKAGKDSLGIDQVYEAETPLVINQAKVKELKTIFIEKFDGNSPIINSIYAYPVANSQDGFGKPFSKPGSKWSTFGGGQTKLKQARNICDIISRQVAILDQPIATQVGFALASPQLVMQGGRRLLTWTFKDFEKAFESFRADRIQIWLSGEKEWIKINLTSDEKLIKALRVAMDSGKFSIEREIDNEAYFIGGNKLFVYLPISSDPVVPFDEKKHKGFNYRTPYPVMQVMMGPEIHIDSQLFESLSFDNQSLFVRVGSISNIDNEHAEEFARVIVNNGANMDGLRKLLLKNDDGILEPGKPFDPFTAYPSVGNSLYIGSDEIFNKPINELSINVQLVTDANADELQEARLANLRLSILQRKEWIELWPEGEPENSYNFSTIRDNILADQPSIKLPLRRKPITYNKDFKDDTFKGFLQIQNNGLARFFLRQQDTFEVLARIAKYYKIKDISLSYSSTLDVLDPTIDQFFHVYPFGALEAYVQNDSYLNNREILANINELVPETISFTKRRLHQRAAFILEKGNRELQVLKKIENRMLVDGLQKLLPQFTYTSPYAGFEKDKTRVLNYRNLLGSMGRLDWKDEAIPAVLETSGFRQRMEGETNQYHGSIQEEGMLYIGLENLLPLQTISLLFQFAEGSAEDEEKDPPRINWSYLSYNEWKPLREENLVSDSTFGFQTTGIVKIDVPSDASLNNTILAGDLIWLCASVTEYSDRIPMLIDVVAQAVAVSFIDNNNAPSHFENALPAETIAELSIKAEEIETVLQPFASFDGKAPERGLQFYTRVSERLRHKGRAITPWDYERLVLNRFPSIYKVKAVPHTDPNCACRNTTVTSSDEKRYILSYNSDSVFDESSISKITDAVQELTNTPTLKLTVIPYVGINGPIALVMGNKVITLISTATGVPIPLLAQAVPGGPHRTIEIVLKGYPQETTHVCCGPQDSPGHVLIVPISNLKNRNGTDPLRPKTSRLVLLAIRDYLKKRTSAFVNVHVRNPVYEQVLVSFKVKFHYGVDRGYHLKKLNEEIVHFLTPWAFDANAEVVFGQKIYASAIINFIEERAYVDFITDFIMLVCRDKCCDSNSQKEVEGINPLVGDANLLSATSAWFPGKEEAMKAFTDLCGCSGVEYLLTPDKGFIGEVVAKPSGPRHILVSAPQHIILPFEPVVEPSPCEKRAKAPKLLPIEDEIKVKKVRGGKSGKPGKRGGRKPNR